MSNNQLIEYKENFISKIRKFFKNLFKRNKNSELEQHVNFEKISLENKESFLQEIKVEVPITNNDIKMKEFLNEIDGNREALNNLSIDRLKKLRDYYDSIIEENDKLIRKLSV